MIVSVTKYIGSSGRMRKKINLQCDYCQIEFSSYRFKHVMNNTNHFCSIKHLNFSQKKNGIVDLKKQQIFLNNFGVINPLQSTTVKEKIENKFFDFIKDIFINVERQVIVNGWAIDFYINDINTYIQFDGVYWHGLDRPLEKIQEYKTKRDIIIEKCYFTDIKQNQWFKNNDKNLVRITDLQFKTLSKEEIKNLCQNHQ